MVAQKNVDVIEPLKEFILSMSTVDPVSCDSDSESDSDSECDSDSYSDSDSDSLDSEAKLRTARDIVREGLRMAARYGHTELARLLLTIQKERLLDDIFLEELLLEAVMSDNADTCAAILDQMPQPRRPTSHQVVDVVKERRRDDIVRLLLPLSEDEELTSAYKIKLKNEILNNKASVLEILPKSVEFRYNNEMIHVRPLLQSGAHVPFTTLLDALHLPEAHPDRKCPTDCVQKDQCSKVQQAFHLVKMIVSEMGEIDPVFKLGKGRHPSIVGSLKEGTRCFFLNELDVHMSLNKRLRKFCYFDVEKQQLRVTNTATEDVKKYANEEGLFDCDAFFEGFVDALIKAVRNIDISQGYSISGEHKKFTLLPLNLRYNPCLRCMDTSDHGRPRARRCRHQANCSAHHIQSLPECEDGCAGDCNFFSHKRTCNCEESTSPCLTLTKIGVALHLQFEDDSRMDCDLNVPTIPTSSEYSGSVMEVEEYLDKARPVGWIEERRKLEEMGSSASSHHLLDVDAWQVKMRRINRDMVLPRQVILKTLFLWVPQINHKFEGLMMI